MQVLEHFIGTEETTLGTAMIFRSISFIDVLNHSMLV